MNEQMKPSFFIENEARKMRWSTVTEGVEAEMKDVMERPELVRIALEMMLENYTDEVLAKRLNVPGHRLATMNDIQLMEAIDSSAVSTFDKFSLGLYRRTVPKLFAKSLVSIQPTPIPDARVFFLEHQYGTTVVGGATAGDRLDDMTAHDPYYSGTRMYLEAVGTGNGILVNFDLDRAGTQNHKVYLAGVLQASTAYTVAAGAGAGGVDQLQFVAAPGAVAITCTYDNIAEAAQAREVKFQMSSTLAESESFKLRAGFSVETDQNFKAYHGLSAESELTSAMSNELERELDSAILLDLINRAGAGNVNWNSAGFLPGDTSTTFREDYKRTLYQSIVEANNLVYNTMNVETTWMVCGVGFAQRLEQLEKFGMFKPSNNPDNFDIQQRVEIGTLQGRWKVYKCSRVPDAKALLGYKGASPFHTGYVWAPFILMHMTKLLEDPTITFQSNKGIMSRGARVMIRPEMYATVTVV